MPSIADVVQAAVDEHGFSGVVRVDRDATTEVALAAGFADRAHGIPNELGTRFGMASGSKTFTALVIVSLIADGTLSMSTTARSLLDTDLPLIDDAVTIEHLLTHRSGIGDHIDEDDESIAVTDYVMQVPVHVLDGPEAWLEVLGPLPPKFTPGAAFSYCNAGFVLLSLLAERASGTPYPELVRTRVLEPAGLTRTDLLRTDSLPGDVAIGYLDDDGLRTNVLHLPVVPSGDGGATTDVADVHRFWDALFAGRIVADEWVTELVRPHTDTPHRDMRYGLGLWVRPSGAPQLEGYDAGVSFRSVRDPAMATTWTVVSNTSEGTWPVAKAIAAAFEE